MGGAGGILDPRVITLQETLTMAITVHIIDSSKPSLVMTSEVFKDKIPGSIVSFSLTAKDGLMHLQSKQAKELPDALVVDFNLPDADGVMLIKELRKFYKGPIFMTAYPDKIVDMAVQEELFHYHDACCWVPKPVRYEALEARIEQFVVNRHRLGKRFEVDFPSLLVGKGEGRGKRAPKFDGKLINISMGGLCVSFKDAAKMKLNDEFTVTMGVPAGMLGGATALSVLKPLIAATRKAQSAAMKMSAPKGGKKLSPAEKSKLLAAQKAAEKASANAAAEMEKVRNGGLVAESPKMEEYKIKATVAWLAEGGKKIGLQFAKLPESQKRQIEVFLKGLSL
jgi:CheY-like chemotaxis protein